jgi:Kef-type K+ transport system membrane component KefB
MPERLLLLIVVVVSYLAANVAFERLARRLSVVSGAEYLLLGLLLGPDVGGLLTPSTIESFSPLVTLGLGWIGASAGVHLALPALVRTPAAQYRVALAEACIATLFIGLAGYVLLRLALGMDGQSAGVVAAALGLLGLPASRGGVTLLARGRSGHPVVRQLQVATTLQSVLASAGVATMMAVLHATPSSMPRPLVPTEWAVITVLIGVIGGLLFHIFIGDEAKVDRLFISLAGAVVLVSGAAAALRLSPVFAALIFGVVLGNTRRNRSEIVATLSRIERPLYFALLLFAGASWRSTGVDALVVIGGFLLIRPLGRIGAARLAARVNHMMAPLGSDWGWGLIGHGGFALIVAFDYLRQGILPAGSLVFSCVAVSVLLTEAISARLVNARLRLDRLWPVEPSGPPQSSRGIPG